MTGLDPIYIDRIVRMALEEDIGSGDITTLLTVPEDAYSRAAVIAKQRGIIAGQQLAWQVFDSLDNVTEYAALIEDGSPVAPGDVIAEVTGSAHTILAGERVALNFLQRLSGIATLTSEYAILVSHTNARIVDTRKTTPGLRRLEKYAVTVGGGCNHRFGLSDGVLIKDNHIAAAGSIKAAVGAAKSRAPQGLKIEVEVGDLDQLREAIDAGADIVLLDNMPLEMMREAVSIANGAVLLEASGRVNKDNVVAMAETGVDIISIGALTHSAPALDISLDFVEE